MGVSQQQRRMERSPTATRPSATTSPALTTVRVLRRPKDKLTSRSRHGADRAEPYAAMEEAASPRRTGLRVPRTAAAARPAPVSATSRGEAAGELAGAALARGLPSSCAAARDAPPRVAPDAGPARSEGAAAAPPSGGGGRWSNLCSAACMRWRMASRSRSSTRLRCSTALASVPTGSSSSSSSSPAPWSPPPPPGPTLLRRRPASTPPSLASPRTCVQCEA